MAEVKLSVRELVEFLLRTGSIDSRFAGFDRANEGARIHRKLQKAAGEGYQAEVFLSETREVDGIPFTIEGRADGIFQSEDGVTVIDEIKTTAIPTDEIHGGRQPLPLGTGDGLRGHLCQTAGPAPAGCPADLLPDRHRRDRPVSPTFHAGRTGRVLRRVCCGSTPPGPGASWTGTPAGLPVLNALRFPFANVPARAAGSGRAKSTAPAVPERRRRQRRGPALLPGSHRHRQDHERPLPGPESHGRGPRRKALLPHGPQHHPGRRRGRPCPAAGRRPRSWPCAA